jgi:hypothetical protein
VKRNPKKQLKKNMPVQKKVKREFGMFSGKFIVPDGFDDPLPDEILDLFEAPIDLGNGSPKRKKSCRVSN